jgi:D-alanyl-D-alanine carboxypeptidase
VDGIKTGYTRASGFNLMTSAERDGHRVIAIVLGGATAKSRDAHVEDLVEAAFAQLGGPMPTHLAAAARHESHGLRADTDESERRRRADAQRPAVQRLQGPAGEPRASRSRSTEEEMSPAT